MQDMFLRSDDSGKWCLDIQMENGRARQLPLGIENNVQRAALAAYILSGTIPGQRSVGVPWADYDTGEASIVDMDNIVKRQIDTYAGSGFVQGPMPLYIPDETGKLSMQLYTPEEVKQ